ncbi:MAG: adenosine deaminase [Acidobacteriota bacterium]|nr:MAG: adenosine deaminase [Acidobacteriota bacterium]
MADVTVAPEIRRLSKCELHQHVDGSIPVDLLWSMLRRHGLNPVDSLEEMERRLVLQPDEEGSLLAYLDKFHYPLWITQFYENIRSVAEAIVRQALEHNVRTLELRYSPVIHTFAGLTVRQSVRAVLSGINRVRAEHPDLRCGLVVIAMRQHGPHIAKILARQTVGEAEHLHQRSGVVGFDIAGPERGNPPRLFREAFDVARRGGLGVTVHAGEDAGPEYVWQAVDELGAHRIGHGCTAVRDRELLRRLARDGIVVECCLTSNYQTGAVARDAPHPILAFLEAGVPVAICTDNTTVSDTDQDRETARVAELLGASGLETVRTIHEQAAHRSFIGRTRPGALAR